MRRERLDPWAGTAAAMALVLLVVYLWLIGLQEGKLASWFVAALLVGAATAGYGTLVTTPYRRQSLIIAAVLLMVSGVLAMFSIGLPIFVAGAFCLAAVMRHGTAPKR